MINTRKACFVVAGSALASSLALGAAPVAGADDPIWIERSYTTELSWTPPSCMAVEVAEVNGGTRPDHQCNFDDPAPKTFHHVVPAGAPAHVGVNPHAVWGTHIFCRVVEDTTGRVVTEKQGTAGSGDDVNCLAVH
ncbi:hypothetical protein BST23_16690 [Mycolicibacterium elephantis]|uniref:Secreted protein n=1 Tax=Mycolicibacterium elephantis TaxID=81858 RepID=A0A1A0QRA6_9MYCO|nr:hypothetical protein [Mycolicibacterium elephantis]OBB24044.1 hypothetical protein A5762_12905 [Mycolicibacterium elephantis]ORA64406.1 hypothetical protein BST23_16690 [Mycolicibacterium elephantis]